MSQARLVELPGELKRSYETPLIEFGKSDTGRMVARLPGRYVLPWPISVAIQEDLESFRGRIVEERTYNDIADTIREWLDAARLYGLLFKRTEKDESVQDGTNPG